MKVKNCIFGTAGHIDHGKSSLILKLTGTDPDRLKEEKERGITVDLGFAFLTNDQCHISFVDVPGHEKLVKNMIAGATGFDACIFAVDAREGIMPQTIEHTNIIHTLDVKHIIVAVTKSDLLSSDELINSMSPIKSFFNNYNFINIQFICVSIFDEESISKLQDVIFETADIVTEKNSHLPFLLRVDRSFSVKGFGTVVTGTAVSGKVMEGNLLDMLPESKTVKVKGLNVNNHKEKVAYAGQRVAINLGGVDRKDISRGHILAQDNTLTFTNKIYAKIKLFNLKENDFSLRNNRSYPIFIGTAHTVCKLILLGGKEVRNGEIALCVIRLESPYSPFIGEKFLIRGLSPQVTLAGGEVLSISDFGLNKRVLMKALNAVSDRNANKLIDILLTEHIDGLQIPPELQFLPPECQLSSIIDNKNLKLIRQYMILEDRLDQITQIAIYKLFNNESYNLTDLKQFQNFPTSLLSLIENRIVAKAKDAGFVQLGSILKKNEKSDFEKLCDKILLNMKENISLSNSVLISEQFGIDEKTSQNCIKHLGNRGMIIAITDRVWVASSLLEILLKKIKLHCLRNQYIDIKSLKDIVTAPRKILIPLMDYLDTTGEFIDRDHKRYLK